MLLLRLALLAFVTVCVLVLFTYFWVAAWTPGPWFVGRHQGATGIDVDLVAALTVRSPLYWLAVVAVLSAAGWLFRRWVLSA